MANLASAGVLQSAVEEHSPKSLSKKTSWNWNCFWLPKLPNVSGSGVKFSSQTKCFSPVIGIACNMLCNILYILYHFPSHIHPDRRLSRGLHSLYVQIAASAMMLAAANKATSNSGLGLVLYFFETCWNMLKHGALAMGLPDFTHFYRFSQMLRKWCQPSQLTRCGEHQPSASTSSHQSRVVELWKDTQHGQGKDQNSKDIATPRWFYKYYINNHAHISTSDFLQSSKLLQVFMFRPHLFFCEGTAISKGSQKLLLLLQALVKARLGVVICMHIPPRTLRYRELLILGGSPQLVCW